MQCNGGKWPSTEEYQEEFASRAELLRIPLSGTFELTRRCNLNCVHCYLGPQAGRQAFESFEMSTGRIHSLLDEITDAGCLHLLITGGDPLLREDFPEIYRHAKENGVLVTVFTNGTLITDRILKLFTDLPPLDVEISIYGATAETYERVTRVPGSYEKCLRGVRGLLHSGIKVNLKTILMTINRHEFAGMKSMAKAFGVRFRFDAAISPCINGDKAPLSFRVPAEEAIEKEFSDHEQVQSWKKFHEKFKGCKLANDLYACGAGVTLFHIDPYGYLQPCIMTLDVQYDISGGGFRTGWDNIVPLIRGKKVEADFFCGECDKISLCGYCPAFFRLENGLEGARSEYLCEMGNLRFHYINDCLSKGGHGGQPKRI